MITHLWNAVEQRARTVLIALSAGITLLAPVGSAGEHEDAVQVTAVQAYLARHIETGEIVGHFLHVHANVTMSEATGKLLFEVHSASAWILTARLAVNGRQFLQCGSGGNLGYMELVFRRMSEKDAEEPGLPISPLFYVPEGTLGNGTEVDLTTLGEEILGRGPESRAVAPVSPEAPPVQVLARSPVPWTQELLDGAGAVQAEWVSVKTEEVPDGRNPSTIRSVQEVQLRLPAGFPRVLDGGYGKLYCGTDVAEDSFNIGSPTDTLVARFESQADTLNCRWEIRFPAFGVKLDLELVNHK